MIAREITYRDLDAFLTQLGFEESISDRGWRVYHHSPSDTLIVLAGRDDSLPARDSDLVSIRRHLVENELIEPVEFEEFLACAD